MKDTSNKPNVLWIILDDSSHKMFSFAGGKSATPHIDRIANEGIFCTSFHTASPICTPSRYSYLTGRYPTHCPSPVFKEGYPETDLMKFDFDPQIDSGDRQNIAALFQDSGYQTGMVGKYHAGPQRERLGCHSYHPDEVPGDAETSHKLKEDYKRQQSYFHSIGFDYAEGISWDNTDSRPLKALQHHNMEWQTDQALNFLDQNQNTEKPFFLYFATTTQHGPHHCESLTADPRITEWGLLEKAPEVQASRESVLERCAEADEKERHLAAGAIWTDDAVGALLDKLEQNGQLENTLIIFSTDHGPGTRSGKFTCYQGGAHIPFVMRYPATLPAAVTCDALMQNVDVLPTLADICGLQSPDWMLDGINMLPQLHGETESRDDLYFELGGYRSVRTQKWKWISLRYPQTELEEMKSGKVDCAYRAVLAIAGGDYAMHLYPHYFDADQLYDLENDPDEQENLFGKPGYEDITREMQQRLKKYLKNFAHPYPENADPFVKSTRFRELCARSLKDQSIFQKDWYQSYGW